MAAGGGEQPGGVGNAALIAGDVGAVGCHQGCQVGAAHAELDEGGLVGSDDQIGKVGGQSGPGLGAAAIRKLQERTATHNQSRRSAF